MDFLEHLKHSLAESKITPKIEQILHNFYNSYQEAVTLQGRNGSDYIPLFEDFLERVETQLLTPYLFPPYHQRILEPFDYYHFGLKFIRPLIIFSESKVLGLEYVDTMAEQLSRGENVVLFSNHQTEPDPQAISLLLDRTHPKFAEEMVIVAGHRVTTDPLAVPFSKGRNLLCIYSKRHIAIPTEQKEEKLLHNQRVMLKMGEMFAEGGKCIFMAPSGGRDRPNAQGTIEVSPFDPQSIELFRLIAKQSGKPTHFYPLTLSTYNLMPPPNTVEKELGERRKAQCTPVHIMFGNEIDMEMKGVAGVDRLDKKERKALRAEHIWSMVKGNYERLMGAES